MDEFAQQFQKKFQNILKNENLNVSQASKIIGLTYSVAFDYKDGNSGPSAQNIAKIIKAYPQYTYYLLNIDSELPEQIIPKD